MAGGHWLRTTVVILSIVLLAALSLGLLGVVELNQYALDTAAMLFQERADLVNLPGEIAEKRCEVYWLQALQARQVQDDDLLDESLMQAISCHGSYVPLARVLEPDNLALALAATGIYPDLAEAWFWAGDLQPDQRQAYYRQGLTLDPNNGRRWLDLAQILRETDPQGALAAYLEACYLGDPGYKACQGAGSLAEAMGDVNAAIRYYRLSGWEPIARRADQLEASLEEK